MEDFWKSVQTIQAERGADYRAFSLFSATHWAELLGAAAVIFLCAVIYYRCREVTRHQILRAVFVLMLADHPNQNGTADDEQSPTGPQECPE